MEVAATVRSLVRAVEVPRLDVALESHAVDTHIAELLAAIGRDVDAAYRAPGAAVHARLDYLNGIANLPQRRRVVDPVVHARLNADIVQSVEDLPRVLESALAQARSGAEQLGSPELRGVAGDLARRLEAARPAATDATDPDAIGAVRSLVRVLDGEATEADRSFVHARALQRVQADPGARYVLPWRDLVRKVPGPDDWLLESGASIELGDVARQYATTGTSVARELAALETATRMRSGSTLAAATNVADVALLRDAQVGATSRAQLLQGARERTSRVAELLDGVVAQGRLARAPRDASQRIDTARMLAHDLADVAGAARRELSAPMLPDLQDVPFAAQVRSRALARLDEARGELTRHLEVPVPQDRSRRNRSVAQLGTLTARVEQELGQLLRIADGEELFARMQSAAAVRASRVFDELEGADAPTIYRTFARHERAAADALGRLSSGSSDDLVADWARVAGTIRGHGITRPAAMPFDAHGARSVTYRGAPGTSTMLGPPRTVDAREGLAWALEHAGVTQVRSLEHVPSHLRQLYRLPAPYETKRIGTDLARMAEYHDAAAVMDPHEAYMRTLARDR